MSAPASGPRAAVRRPTGDVPILPALVAAVPLYGLALLGARNAPRYVEELLLERGWVPHAILVLTAIALAILGAKALALRSQRRAFAVELVPGDVVDEGSAVGPEQAAEAVRRLDAVRVERARRRTAPSLLLERARRVLDGFAARGDVAEATALSNADAETDAVSFASSLSTVKVLVWAIPILGFIGTVIGISDAVAGFSRSLDGAEQLDVVKASLGDVTSGLAVAFDTTLVALVASIVVMLPTSWIQKADEALVADVDEAITTHVLRRLGAAPTAVVGPAEPAASPEAAQAAFVAQLAQLAAVAHTLGPAVERATAHLDVVSSRVDDALAQLARAVTQLERATSLAEHGATSAGDAHDQLARELGASRQLLQLLAAGLGATGGGAPRANGRKAADHRHGAAAVHAEE